MDKDYSQIDERLIPYFMRSERVEVILKEGYELFMGYGCRTEGRKLRFYVGISTGWMPIFLQILNKNSRGGMAVLSDSIEDVRGLSIYSHHPEAVYHQRNRDFLEPFQAWKEAQKQ